MSVSWCTLATWMSILSASHPYESHHHCIKRQWSWRFWLKKLSWISFIVVIAVDASPLTTFLSQVKILRPCFVACSDLEQKCLPIRIEATQQFNRNWLACDYQKRHHHGSVCLAWFLWPGVRSTADHAATSLYLLSFNYVSPACVQIPDTVPTCFWIFIVSYFATRHSITIHCL